MEYRHTQTGGIITAALVFVIFLAFLPFISTGTYHPILIPIVIFFVVALILFYSLSVEIKDDTLICTFGIGLIRKRVPLSEIQTAQAVYNPWYAGWGIRWLPGRYWLWNVSGLRAVELILKDGKRFRIGTDEPDALLNAIESNITKGN